MLRYLQFNFYLVLGLGMIDYGDLLTELTEIMHLFIQFWWNIDLGLGLID